MAYILCIEAGTDIASVALARNGKLLSLRENLEGKQHARNLAVYTEEILKENHLHAEELDAVAVGKGPGSYTGLRIAVSLAKGICYGAGKPLIAVNSLEALSRVALEDFDAGILDLEEIADAKLLPMIDARRMEVYCQLFDAEMHPLSDVDAHIITAESFAEERSKDKLVAFGNGSNKCREVFREPNVHFIEVTPSARGLIKPAFEALRINKFEDTAYFEPFYLKNFIVNSSSKRFF